MHGKTAEKDTAGEESKSLKAEPKPDLAQAKQNFLAAASEFSPFGVVQRRPFASIGIAFLAGFGLSMIGSSRKAQPALATMGQIVNLVAQFAPLIAARARSSDG